MSAAKHTPGRLGRNIPPVTRYPILYAGRNSHVCRVVTGGGIPDDEAEANADRLVACWNACEGFDDPAAVREAIDLLERIYLANKCPGIVNGEAALCPAYADRARDLLVQLGRKP